MEGAQSVSGTRPNSRLRSADALRGSRSSCHLPLGIARHLRHRGHWSQHDVPSGPCPAQRSTAAARLEGQLALVHESDQLEKVDVVQFGREQKVVHCDQAAHGGRGGRPCSLLLLLPC